MRSVEVHLSTRFYTLTALDLAREAYDAICRASWSSAGNSVRLTLEPLPGAGRNFAHAFLNYALCASVEDLLGGAHV